jgi:5-methylcytosine-specific restriction endonuclease McrA
VNQRAKVLSIVATDTTFERATDRYGPAWVGKCIHCNARLRIALNGDSGGLATVEHIVARHHGGDDSVENLALACARCNHQKGARLDCQSRHNPRLWQVLDALRARRLARMRAPICLR